jgi:hypothetical protein
MTARWPDTIDQVIGGDQAVVMAHVTPARGVVLTPLTNFGIRDQEAGRATPLNSSVGMWKKLRRLQENPRLAVAYHTREHAFTDRPEYVLLQGTASVSALDDRGWLERNRENWERFAGPRNVGPLWERWLRVYHWRVGIEIDVERLIVWPDLACRGPAQVYGAPLPDKSPPSQGTPNGGTAPRINHRRAARRAARLPNKLLGWVGADGLPMVIPVSIGGTDDSGILLDAPDGWVPGGGRRAGFVSHTFARYTYGQNQRKHTGWLEADPTAQRVVYSPLTQHGYHLPWSRTVYRLGAGFVTRRGYREGRRAGFLPN